MSRSYGLVSALLEFNFSAPLQEVNSQIVLPFYSLDFFNGLNYVQETDNPFQVTVNTHLGAIN